MTAPEIPLRLPLAHEVRKAPGLTRFLKGHLLHSEKGSRVRLHKNQDSSSMNSLLESSVWVLLPDDSEQFSQGSLLDVYPF
jgi:molybdopterin biosynthesis enzyme